MERLAHPFNVHSASPAAGTFQGMASVFNTLIDTWIPTRIRRGAFTTTIRDNQHRIKVLWQHQAECPIGVPLKMEETEHGLFVEAKISQTSLGKDVLQLLKDKVITELSIGFDPLVFTMADEMINGVTTKVRHITEVKLWEFSPVTFAANRDALVTSVHRRSGVADHVDAQLAELNRLQLQLLDSDLRALDRRRP